jgi:hypothetical protein
MIARLNRAFLILHFGGIGLFLVGLGFQLVWLSVIGLMLGFLSVGVVLYRNERIEKEKEPVYAFASILIPADPRRIRQRIPPLWLRATVWLAITGLGVAFVPRESLFCFSFVMVPAFFLILVVGPSWLPSGRGKERNDPTRRQH